MVTAFVTREPREQDTGPVPPRWRNYVPRLRHAGMQVESVLPILYYLSPFPFRDNRFVGCLCLEKVVRICR